MILWPKWLRLWDEWETSSRDFCVIPEILPCIRVIALDSWKMQTAFSTAGDIIWPQCHEKWLRQTHQRLYDDDKAELSVPVTMKFACGECESWEIFENLDQKKKRRGPGKVFAKGETPFVICLKESKRDNEYLIASALSGSTEPFVYIFAAPTFLLRFVLVCATVHHSCFHFDVMRHVNKAVDGKQIRE